MRSQIEGALIANAKLRHGNSFRILKQALGATWTIAVGMPQLQFLDPGGSGRTVLLPAEADSKGLFFELVNTADAAEDLTVKEDSGTTTIAVVGQGDSGLFFCDGTTWFSFRGGRSIKALGSGVTLAKGTAQALDGSNPTPVATGLATIVYASVQLRGTAAPGDNTSVLTVDYSGADGTLNVYAWKNTGGTDPTLVASTGTETFDWLALGT